MAAHLPKHHPNPFLLQACPGFLFFPCFLRDQGCGPSGPSQPPWIGIRNSAELVSCLPVTGLPRMLSQARWVVYAGGGGAWAHSMARTETRMQTGSRVLMCSHARSCAPMTCRQISLGEGRIHMHLQQPRVNAPVASSAGWLIERSVLRHRSRRLGR